MPEIRTQTSGTPVYARFTPENGRFAHVWSTVDSFHFKKYSKKRREKNLYKEI